MYAADRRKAALTASMLRVHRLKVLTGSADGFLPRGCPNATSRVDTFGRDSTHPPFSLNPDVQLDGSVVRLMDLDEEHFFRTLQCGFRGAVNLTFGGESYAARAAEQQMLVNGRYTHARQAFECIQVQFISGYMIGVVHWVQPRDLETAIHQAAILAP